MLYEFSVTCPAPSACYTANFYFLFRSLLISSFLSNSSLYSIDSSERTAPMASVPSIVSVKAWDGKDAEVVQEEVPLDQLFGDD